MIPNVKKNIHSYPILPISSPFMGTPHPATAARRSGRIRESRHEMQLSTVDTYMHLPYPPKLSPHIPSKVPSLVSGQVLKKLPHALLKSSGIYRATAKSGISLLMPRACAYLDERPLPMSTPTLMMTKPILTMRAILIREQKMDTGSTLRSIDTVQSKK